MQQIKSSKRSFSLMEVLISTAILSFVLCGLLLVYVDLFVLGDMARQFTLANNAAQAKLEELRNTSFNSLASGTFTVGGFAAADARGVVEVSNTGYPDLKVARIVISFRQKGQRIIGEDNNLNGIFEAGEDINGNTRLDSPVEIITLISR